MTSSISITSNSGFFLRSVRLIAFFPLSRLSIDSKRTFCKPHSYWQLSHPELRCIDASASDHQHLTLNLLENVWGQRKIDQEDNTNRQIICPIVQCGLMSSRASLAVRFTNPIPEIQIRIGTEVLVLIIVCGGMGVKMWCDACACVQPGGDVWCCLGLLVGLVLLAHNYCAKRKSCAAQWSNPAIQPFSISWSCRYFNTVGRKNFGTFWGKRNLKHHWWWEIWW